MEQIRVATFAGPGTQPVIHSVPRPKVPGKAALMQVGACGVCGTDLHILAGHWPKPLPWPLTLGHEVAGVLAEMGDEFREDYMSNRLRVGDKIMIPPFMPCGRCYFCIHYPKYSNKCLNPVYYGRYLGFDKPPHLWGRWAEAEYLDFEMLPGTKVYRLPDDMPLWLGTLAEPLSSTIHGLKRAQEMGVFQVGDTVVIQGSGPIGVLAIVAALEMGAGRVIVVGAPEEPRLALCRKFGVESTVDIMRYDVPEKRIAVTREIVGGLGADVVIECTGHPSSGPEGIEMLRDGGTYIEMGQFTNAGSIDTNWHRICAKSITIIGSWAFTADDIALGIKMLHRSRNRFPFQDMQTRFPFSEDGIVAAIKAARAMQCIKATIVPNPAIVD